MSRLCESYIFQVADKKFSIQFMPVFFFEDYTDEQLDRLEQSVVYEVSFRLEECVLPNGNIVEGYGVLGTGNAFRVLGGAANGILKWAKEKQPDYLYWHALEPNRQRLYNRMVGYFQSRSGLRRLEKNPFTGGACPPGVFWVGRHP